MGRTGGLVFSAEVWTSAGQCLHRWSVRLFLPFGAVFWSDQVFAASFTIVLDASFQIQYLLSVITYFNCSSGFQQIRVST